MCGDVNPDGLVCSLTFPHRQHLAYVGHGINAVVVHWPNPDYQPPALTKADKQKQLTEIARQIRNSG